MKRITFLIFIAALFITLPAVQAQEEQGYQHENTTQNEGEHSDHSDSEKNQQTTGSSSSSGQTLAADFDEFPNLHPLVVHFPVVLLLVSALLALVQIFWKNASVDWVLTALIFGGALGAYAAANWFHPHGHNLTEHMKSLLNQHESYAQWTVWLGIAAFVLQLVSQFVVKQKTWMIALVAATLLGSAYTVSKAGHLGSQMVYLEGIGPQGNHVEGKANHKH